MPVTGGVYFIDVDAINDATQEFSIDMFFRISWWDPKLALPEYQRTGQMRLVLQNNVWSPRGLIINDGSLRPKLPFVAEIDDLGNVRYRQRVTGSLPFDSELHRFPFDS